MTTPSRRRLDQLLDPSYVSGLSELPDDELRDRLQAAREEEDDLSYLRRLLHGRLDIMRAELEARRTGHAATHDIDALRAALGEAGTVGGGRGARPSVAVRVAAAQGRRRAERLVSENHLARLPDMDAAEIEQVVERTSVEEREISDDRRRLHEVIDLLEGELARRYREGGLPPPI